MRAHIKLWANSQFHYPFLNPSSVSNKIPKLLRIRTLIFPMAAQSGSTKRPTCPSCSKPTRICLCNRLRTPILHNSVAVTILQHSLEKKHPLNSTRIATIGLRNVDVFTVSDVNFEAQFSIRLLDSGSEMGRVKFDESGHLFDEMPSREKSHEFLGTAILGDIIEKTNAKAAVRRQLRDSINFTVVKYGAITSSNNNCKMTPDKCQEMSFDQLLASDTAFHEIQKGFMVKKTQTKPAEGIKKLEASEEFEITVPPGSVLLFPSERSVAIESIDFKVKNLIVLDGTWAKAKRMFNENPWLRLLPHVRLDLHNLSLYGEVRHQPRAGYLSTIESIVYAMKGVGEDSEGLDGLLDVFESMVGDQRWCKKERLSKVSEK